MVLPEDMNLTNKDKIRIFLLALRVDAPRREFWLNGSPVKGAFSI